jgi:hypothetical protein
VSKVKRERNQSNCQDDHQRFSLEDEVLVDEFCSLLASVAIRILASEGQEVYNCSSSDKKGASKR